MFHLASDQKWYVLPTDCVYVCRVVRTKKCYCFPTQTLLIGFEARRQNCEKRLLASSYVSPSIRPFPWNNSTPTRQIFMEFDICVLFEKYIGKIQVSLKSDKNNGYFTWTSLNSSWNKTCFRKKLYTHLTLRNFLFRKSCHFRDNTKNVLQPDRPRTKI
jgi:hypothetical protein